MSPRSCVFLLSLLALTGLVATTTVEGNKYGNNDVTDWNDVSQAPVPPADDFANNELVDDDDEDGNGLDPESKIEGIPVKYLTVGEIYQIADDRDVIDQGEWDILAEEKLALERSNQPLANKGSRKKRWISFGFRVLVSAGRAVFRGSRAGRVTTSGRRATRQYQKSGNYKDAVKDFDRFKPDDVKSFNGKISGQSGKFGKHKLTVRNGSKDGGPPTLDIRSPRKDGSTYVRKFRYNDNQ